MIDQLHSNLLLNICCQINENREKAPEISDLLDPLFIDALKYFAEREALLTPDDWREIGFWLLNCEQYYERCEFRFASLVLSVDCSKSGKQELDLSDFVAKAREAYQRSCQRTSG